MADISYTDTTDGDSEVVYEYDVLPGGALRILQVARGKPRSSMRSTRRTCGSASRGSGTAARNRREKNPL